MTARKRSYTRRGRASPVEDERSPSFNSVWKTLLTVFTGVMTAAVLALAAWVWNTNGALSSALSAAGSNTEAIKTLTARADHEQETVGAHAATLATLQVQITNAQTIGVSNNATLAERVRSLEQQNIWRDRSMPQQQGRGSR